MTAPGAPGSIPGLGRSARRTLVPLGAILVAAATALSAYAAHAAGDPRSLYLAAFMAFGHGLALASLAPAARRRLTLLALSAVALGVLLFSGNLVTAHLLAIRAPLAPFGGGLMIFGWLLYAADAARR